MNTKPNDQTPSQPTKPDDTRCPCCGEELDVGECETAPAYARCKTVSCKLWDVSVVSPTLAQAKELFQRLKP